MSEKRTICFVLLLIFVITLTSLVILEKTAEHGLEQEELFYTSDFSEHETIFLIGSSHIAPINATKVNNLIPSDNPIKVFNLAQNSDTPTNRIKTLDYMISAQPEIVFYGISYRDFQFSKENTELFFSFQQLLPHISQTYNILDENLPSNPQWLMRNTLNKMLIPSDDAISTELIYDPYTPFHPYNKNQQIPTSMPELNYLENWEDEIYIHGKNANISNLQKIISKFQERGIVVVIFTTPLHENYLEWLSDFQKEEFLHVKKNLVDKYGIKIYEFEGKYSKMEMWSDPTHIAVHDSVNQFNEDIANMILMEINS